jgi:DNA-3-methyladenine glycosylase II
MPRPGAGTELKPVPATPEATEALRKSEKVMRKLIDAAGEDFDPDERRRGRLKDPYGTLLRSIVGQQLSTKAAATIFGRVIDLFDGHTPTPVELLAIEPEKLREAGLSWPKVGYLRDLAERVEDGRLDLKRLPKLADEDVVAELIQIKGVGQWTAEVFVMFHLGRPDVLPVGDLGIRRAVQLAYGLEELPGPEELRRIAEPWRPHRTLACLYLWRSLHNDPV